MVLVVLPEAGDGPRCDRAGSRTPRIPGAGRPSYRSMPGPFLGRAMRIIGMGCQAVLLPMTIPCSKVGSAGSDDRLPGVAGPAVPDLGEPTAV